MSQASNSSNNSSPAPPTDRDLISSTISATAANVPRGNSINPEKEKILEMEQALNRECEDMLVHDQENEDKLFGVQWMVEEDQAFDLNLYLEYYPHLKKIISHEKFLKRAPNSTITEERDMWMKKSAFQIGILDSSEIKLKDPIFLTFNKSHPLLQGQYQYYYQNILEHFDNIFRERCIVLESTSDTIIFFAEGVEEIPRQYWESLDSRMAWGLLFDRQMILRNTQTMLNSLKRLSSVSTNLKAALLCIEEYERDENLVGSDLILYRQNQSKLNSLNSSQKMVIQSALINPITIVRGPPGTGKSTVAAQLLDILRQKLRNQKRGKNVKILVCATTNKAVDRIATIMLKNKLKVTRVVGKMYTLSRAFFSAGEELKKSVMSTHVFNKRFHSKKQVKKSKNKSVPIINDVDFIACTLDKAGSILNFLHGDLGLKDVIFPYTLIDEASQTVEMLTFNSIGESTEKIILLGDDKQLEPLVHNRQNKAKGLTSLFNNIVKKSPRAMLQLDIQYRMHPKLAEFSNTEFYNGEIENGPNTASHLSNRPRSLNFFFPDCRNSRLFINHSHFDMRKNKTFQNKGEAALIAKIVVRMVNRGVNIEDIGVITFYSRQIFFIKDEINKITSRRNNLHRKIQIDTVDAFQGSEKEYIILSTVRSNRNDNIGFLKNQFRLNVALTRAKRGLIIAGNAACLKTNDLWMKLITNFERENLKIDENRLQF